MSTRLWLRQLIQQVGCNGAGCDDCKYQFINTPLSACTLKEGFQRFWLAGRLWERAQAPKPEIEKLAREILDARRLRTGGSFISRAQIERMLGLLDGLEARLLAHFGELPEAPRDLSRFKFERQLDDFGDIGDDGDERVWLAVAQEHVAGLRDFLEYAQKLGREIVYDAE